MPFLQMMRRQEQYEQGDEVESGCEIVDKREALFGREFHGLHPSPN